MVSQPVSLWAGVGRSGQNLWEKCGRFVEHSLKHRSVSEMSRFRVPELGNLDKRRLTNACPVK
jgi:hypothetical protein